MFAMFSSFSMSVFEGLAIALILAVGLVIALVAVLFVVDRTQTQDAIRRNYPVVGRFRVIFTTLGEFFRQYFFAMDREELPFNRAQRYWVKHTSEGGSSTVAFGSTRNLAVPGTPIFTNDAFPPLDTQFASTDKMVIGAQARQPYIAGSIFNLSGMSYGAISKPAVQALSKGCAEAGIWMNTGEGGLSPYHLEGGCDIVFQMGTAKFGVRDAQGSLDDEKLRALAAHPAVKMIEIKLTQGAKPGKGGILPAAKISVEIAQIRGLPQGVNGISPNRHAEANNWSELLDFIAHVREVSGLPTGIKTVMGSEAAFEEFFDAISEHGGACAPDFITLDGGEGGTGAAPMPLMDLVGVSIREALLRLSAMRNAHGLKDRIRIVASGKLVNPGDVAWALCAGADFVTSARGFMFSLGCIQALKCNKNTCPTGITTHDPRLQKGLVPTEKYKKVAAYAKGIIKDVEMIAHSVGVTEPRKMRRDHVRIVQPDGASIPLSILYPSPGPKTLGGSGG